jgi:hypothetical protein
MRTNMKMDGARREIRIAGEAYTLLDGMDSGRTLPKGASCGNRLRTLPKGSDCAKVTPARRRTPR